MIKGEDIERAERILQVTYREQELPRQLASAEVDFADFNNWLSQRRERGIQKHYNLAYRAADPRLHSAYATLLMHFFLVGLVCGRSEGGEIL